MAGFTWVQTISSYSPITAIAINEIRTNTDYQNDNHSAYCATNYSGDNAAQKTSYNGSNYDYGSGNGNCANW